jgi:hypothetical protein
MILEVCAKRVVQPEYSLAVAGLCRTGKAAFWVERFSRELSNVSFEGLDAYGIDYLLANAVRAVADDSLIVVGASVCLNAAFQGDAWTGGVIGYPFQNACSAKNCLEDLPEGLKLYTRPGGPGVAAKADERVLLRVVEAISSARKNKDRKIRIHQMMKRANIQCYVVVEDGTGPGARGLVAAAADLSEAVFIALDQ